MKKHKLKNIALLTIGVGCVLIGVLIIWISTLNIPDFKSFTERKVASSTKIYDRTGTIVLYNLQDNIRRTVIPYGDMGQNIKNATIAIEDADFYKHNGIRLKSIARVVWYRFLGKSNAGGGSTITQQLIKNTLLTSEKTLTRKLKEWILAVKLEKVATKDEILGLYLNEAPYGGTIYGIAEGAKTFFDKEPKDITIAEAAYLAAIPNSPTYYSPYKKHRKELDARKNLVLKKMYDLQFIGEQEYTNAKNEVVAFLPEQPVHIAAPHFVFFVKQYLEQKYGTEMLETGGLKVITTLDYNIETQAEKIVHDQALENEKTSGGKNAAVVVINPNTGEILSMVGSRDYFDKTIDGNFNVATALRQPGSAFKPFVYATAFNKGYTGDTVLFDVPTEFSDGCDAYGNPRPGHKKTECYMPGNYDNKHRGPMSLRNALAQSINVPAVKLLYLAGIKDSIATAKNMGISSLNEPDRYGLSLVIGGAEVTLLDITSAYGVFATEGILHPYKSILSVSDHEGNILEETKDEPEEVLPVNTTRMISDILSDNSARTPTFGANSSLVIPGASVAVKTGTTNDNKDAWTVGYSSSLVVGAWVGNNDNIPMKKGGAALAGPIWNKVLSVALTANPGQPFEKPEQTDPNTNPILKGKWQSGETILIDKTTGQPATINTLPENKVEQFTQGVHSILYWIDKNNPTGGKPLYPENDSQFNHWETAVQSWWLQNSYNYSVPTSTTSVNTHTEQAKPIITITGIDGAVVYNRQENIPITITTQTLFPIQKVDVFMNNEYITSIKESVNTILLAPKNNPDIKSKNSIKVIAYDIYGNTSESSITLYLKN